VALLERTLVTRLVKRNRAQKHPRATPADGVHETRDRPLGKPCRLHLETERDRAGEEEEHRHVE